MTITEIAPLELEAVAVPSKTIERLTRNGICKCIKKDRSWVHVLNPQFEEKTLELKVLRFWKTLSGK